MMRSILLIIVVTYVSASGLLKIKGFDVLIKDEETAVKSIIQNVKDHKSGDEEKNWFDENVAGPREELFKALNGLSDEDLGLDDSTDTGFVSDIEGMMKYVWADVCDQSVGCKESIMGCSCRGSFNKLNETMCKDFPCNFVKQIMNKTVGAAQLLKDIRDQKSLEGLVGVVMKFAEPILRNACHCNPSLFTTTVSCVKGYDGVMLPEEDREDYAEFMSKIKFDDLVMYTKTMFRAYCGTEDGKCLGSFQNVFTEVAAMMDRSCSDKKQPQCNNFRRLSDGIRNFERFIEDVLEDLIEEKDLPEWKIIAVVVGQFYRNIPRNFWCGKKACAARYLSEKFNNNCCFRNAAERFDEKTVNYLMNYIGSIVEATGNDMPKIHKKVIMWISRMFNPNKACARKYSKSADTCDAVKGYGYY